MKLTPVTAEALGLVSVIVRTESTLIPTVAGAKDLATAGAARFTVSTAMLLRGPGVALTLEVAPLVWFE